MDTGKSDLLRVDCYLGTKVVVSDGELFDLPRRWPYVAALVVWTVGASSSCYTFLMVEAGVG